MREVDGDVELQSRRRRRLVHGVAVDHADWRAQSQILHLARLLRDPGLAQELDEGPRAPVHHGGLGAAQLHHDVIQLASSDGREDVLNGMNRHRVVPQLRAALREHCILGPRRNERRTGQVRATKDDARAARGGDQRQSAWNAEMETDSLDRRRLRDGAARHRWPPSLSPDAPSSRSMPRSKPERRNSAAWARNASLCGRAG